MVEAMKTIDLLTIIPEPTRIRIGKSSQKSLLEKSLQKAGSQKKLAQILNVNRCSIWRLMNLKSRPTINQLNILQNLTDNKIPLSKIVLGIEAGKREIEIDRILTVNEDLMWFLGLWEGDNADNKRRLGIGNTDLEVIKRATRFLKSWVGKKEISVVLEFPQGMEITEEKKLSILQTIDIDNAKSIKCKNKDGRKKFFIVVKIDSAPLKNLFLSIRQVISKEIIELDENLRSAFVQGFFDAEGSINKIKKITSFWQRGNKVGIERLNLIKNILESLNIQTSKITIQNKKRDIFCLNVKRGKKCTNIKRFCLVINSTSSIKNQKLLSLSSMSLAGPKSALNRSTQQGNGLTIPCHGDTRGNTSHALDASG